MLETRFKFPFEAEDAYNLSMPRCSTWPEAKRRILVVLQNVDSRDLKARSLLGDKDTVTCFKNLIKWTRGYARTYQDDVEAAYTVVNFNQKRHLHLGRQARKQAESEFAEHVHKLIAKTKPTHVFVSGDEAFNALWPQINHHREKRGWVHDLTSGSLKLKVVSSLDFSRLLEKEGEKANLFGFWCRHLTNLILGKDPHSVASRVCTPRYIDTMEKFERLMLRLYEDDLIAVDTETRNLSVKFNAIYTIQFAVSASPDTGYVLPIDHPLQDCWTSEQVAYIKTSLRRFFASRKKKSLLFFNGPFDLRVIRRCLRLPIVWHYALDIVACEHLLDENLVEMNNFGSKVGNLAAVLCSYGNDFYFREDTGFSKKDRSTTGNTKPNDPDFLKYGGTDVSCLHWLFNAACAKANHQFIDGVPYAKAFKRHLKFQMSDTVHQLSHLREDGSKIDAKYLVHLTSNESPLRKEMLKLSQMFRGFEEAVEANSKIIADSGFKSKGLFGAARSKVLNWAFAMKPAHLRILFFDVMKMKPENTTDKGESSVDKAFVEEHKGRNHIVSTYGDYTKLSKLLGTYAKGWLKKLRSNPDSIDDHHLRPEYSYSDVATGRLASKNPSLQTIPSRGKLAKIIKHMFVASKGTLLIRYDYSAHEVRVWAYVGLDKVLAAVFKVGQKLRQDFIQNPTEENKKAIKEKGDIHILNVLRLLGKLVDKEHPLRDSIKAIIFGILYLKSAKTLGEDTKLGDINELKAKVAALTQELMELEKS